MAREVAFVDTNVLLDILTDDPAWAPWSLSQLTGPLAPRRLIVNVIVYAELAVRFEECGGVDAFLGAVGVEVLDIPREAAFLGAKAFAAYRRRGGVRTGVLPDFFIGAHACVLGVPLLTRDPGRYRTAFPDLDLTTP